MGLTPSYKELMQGEADRHEKSSFVSCGGGGKEIKSQADLLVGWISVFYLHKMMIPDFKEVIGIKKT